MANEKEHHLYPVGSPLEVEEEKAKLENRPADTGKGGWRENKTLEGLESAIAAVLKKIETSGSTPDLEFHLETLRRKHREIKDRD